ncbi:ribonuclease HII [Candidatus Giovannonibacteria bacterium]|nr:ribonuclease HII [Candidatus Giovannonibacteria bacterium]
MSNFQTWIKRFQKLSHKQRNEWLKTFKNYANKGNTLYFATSSVGHHIIDQIGITAAARLAVSRVLKKISCYVPGVSSSVILLDGSLYAPRKYLFQKTIIRGDENVPVIAAASVIAKVCRDKKMIRLSKKFPQYSFDLHKGYGTKKHSNAIEKYGLSQAHRRSFCKKFIKVL